MRCLRGIEKCSSKSTDCARNEVVEEFGFASLYEYGNKNKRNSEEHHPTSGLGRRLLI
jgi:hypothetical protein